jgi:hypothetical protein
VMYIFVHAGGLLPGSNFSVKIASVESLKWVTESGLREGFLKLVSNFKGASLNFEFDFFIN